MPTRAVSSPANARTSALDELLATEQEIAAHLQEAERKAESLLAAARADAEACERDAELALARELAALDEATRAERESATRAIEDEAGRTVRHYRSLDSALVERLAAWVAAEVTGLREETPR